MKKPAKLKVNKPFRTRSSSSVDVKTPCIVGIGASAGGLEALELFLSHASPDLDMAFVIVQHLDPTRKGIMVELLQRATVMPVTQITDRMRVKPGHVYVIPPNCDLSILQGMLHLLEPIAPRGLHLPIDFFFRSLAEDQQERSIGVILSGMGSDGTLGIRTIKEKAGMIFVQSPDLAKFDGMPRSAINTGIVDVIAPAEKLVGSIAAFLQHVPLLQLDQPGVALIDKNHSGLEKVVLILRTQTGHDFSLYKKSTIYRRIERRMGLHQLPKIADYVRYMRENREEAGLLFKELLIGVTSFFRDPAIWEQLKTEATPALLAANPKGVTLRAWTTACSTGEEAYSLAIVFHEVLEQLNLSNVESAHYNFQIFATDIDPEAIDKARNGTYSANIAADVSKERLSRYFVQEERGYRVSKEIRDTVIFAPQNLVMDPPFTKLDLITCRNLLIYLQTDLQNKILSLFHYSLNSGGILMLGNSESVGSSSELFAPFPGKSRLYWRQEITRQTDLVEFSTAFAHNPARTGALAALASHPESFSVASLEELTNALLLRFSPAAVLTTGQGDIVYISGKTGKYLEPATGKANLNIFSMARNGLAGALNAAFVKAVRQKTAIILNNITVGTNGGAQVVEVTLQYLTEPAALEGMVLIMFADIVTPPIVKTLEKATRTSKQSAQLTVLTQELQQSREELQTTREEMQSSQEELKSTNEELQSTNEELQSTNEELTTSKEEMQTVNHELVAKVTELEQASDDMKNLLNSTDIATLFLDVKLRVRRFTTQVSSIIKLIPGDVGRPITDLVTELDYPQMAEDVHEVLQTLVYRECQVTCHDGRWFTVRIMPYRTEDNRIDGVVITFADVSQFKELESTLRETMLALKNRYVDQTVELDVSKELEKALNKAQAILEQRLNTQTDELKQSRLDLKSKKRKRP